jgi:hypothetical protein
LTREDIMARSTYRASPRSPHSLRLHDDSWNSFGKAAKAVRAKDANTWSVQVLEAADGYVHCKRGMCFTDTPPIPVAFGDITGMTFGEAAARAVEAAESGHPRHEGQSVFIGAEPAVASRKSASPGAVPFMEPKQAARS